MKITVGNCELLGNELFYIIWKGFFIGASAIFFPISILITLLHIIYSNNFIEFQAIIFPFFLLVIIMFQSAVVAGLVLLGLRIHPPKKVKVINEK